MKMKLKMLCYTATCLIVASCGDACYGRNVSGRIERIAKRMATDLNGSSFEKVAVRLVPASGDSIVVRVAGGAGASLDIECVSTRCANLQRDECAEFTCRHVVTGCDEPDVIECKLLRTAECIIKKGE